MDVAEQLRSLRALASRARRLAAFLSDLDRDRLLEHAAELEQQATELELQAPTAPVVQVQMQVQQQQQQESGPPGAEKDAKPEG
jgi:hypothetical protein